jgi:cytosine/adenosine deaminase-related metal-dependent hydrolase
LTDLLVRGAAGILTGLPAPEERRSGDIRIRQGRIVEIGSLVPAPGEAVVDASGCAIYPGLINTHHHLFQTMLKGVPAGIDLPLEGWLAEVPYRYRPFIDEDALETAALVGIAELILSGVTTIADHHYLATSDPAFDSEAVIMEAASRFGVRMVLCRGGATRSRTDLAKPMPVESLEDMIARLEDLTVRYHDPAPDAMRRVVFAPTLLTWSVAPEHLRAIAQAARYLGLRRHSHLSETQGDGRYCATVSTLRPVAWIGEHDWLGPDVWFAHLVHVDDDEVRLLAETGTGMAHCPQSNCRLGSGVAPADKLAALGGRVSLGVDGSASNESSGMIDEMHCAWYVHRAAKGAGAVRAEEVLRWATAGGADILGLPAVGTIEVGKAADLAIFELDLLRYAGLHDALLGPIVGGVARARHVFVGGRPIVVDGEIPNLDLQALSTRAAGVVRRLAAAVADERVPA